MAILTASPSPRNAASNHLSNCSYLVGGLEEALPRLLQAARPGMEVGLKSFSPLNLLFLFIPSLGRLSNPCQVVAVVDPPRTGLTEKAVTQIR